MAVLWPAWAWAQQAPVVDDLSASSTVVAPGGTVPLTVAAHDPDCAGTCTSGCGLYVRADLTAWSATGGAFVSEDNGTSGSPYAATADWQAPTVEDTYTLTVQLSDSGSFLCGGRQTTTANLDVTVTTAIGEPPVIESLTADPAWIFPGGTSELTCVASDPDGDPLTYSWSTDHGTVTPGAGGAAVFAADEPGLATVVCTAADGFAPASGSLPLSVTGAVAEKSLGAGLVTPQRLAVDSMGDVYVADERGGGIAVLHLGSGELVYHLALPGVRAVAVDWQDRLLTADAEGARLLDRRGEELDAFDPGAPLGEIADVAVDAANRRYGVLYRKAGRVVVYDEAGAVLAAFGATGDGPAQLKSPQGLAATPAGEWAVADSGHGLVKVFDLAGSLLRSFGGQGGGAGKFVQLDDVAVDAAGLVYSSDSFQDWVQVWNPDGTLREVLGTYGDGLGELQTAAGVVPAAGFDRLLAASLNASAVQVFRTSGGGAAPPLPGALLSAGSLAFDRQAVGTTGAPRSLTLANDGGAPLGVRAVSAGAEFAATHDCGAFLEPGAACTLQVAFTPAAVGPRDAVLAIDTSAGPRTVALTGSGYVPRGVVLAPGRLDFAPQEVTSISAASAMALINPGSEPLAIGAIAASAEYRQSNDCPPVLAGGAACTLHVAFAPERVADPISGILTVASDAAGSPHRVALAGSGVENAAYAGPPRVAEVADETGPLETCRPALQAIRRVLVQFSEPMPYREVGPQPGDANHVDSYLLVAAGADQRFDTAGCGAVLGDDEAVPLAGVAYDPETRAATLELAAGETLSAALHRLFVCGGEVRDLAGEPLDGDGDGAGGDDFALTFRSDPANLFENGHFDCDLEGWTALSTFPAEIEHSADDVDGSDVSGSAALVVLAADAVGIGQCLAVEPGRVYRLGAWLRASASSGQTGYVAATCEVFAEADCAGLPVGESTVALALAAPFSPWAAFEDVLETPGGSRSALCSFALSAEPGLEASLDRLVLRADPAIFADGFESGDPAAWSRAIGGTAP